MVNKRIDDESLGYLAIVRREECSDGAYAWVAEHPDLPGCMAHGDSPSEAIENLAEARELYLRDYRARGIAPPAPGISKIAHAILASG